MNKEYYDTVVAMEKAGVDVEYIQGWQGGYVLNPKREEQRVTEAYNAGFADGTDRTLDAYTAWVK